MLLRLHLISFFIFLSLVLPAQEQPLRIAFYLQPGVEVLDFAGPLEVFSYAGFEVLIASKNKQAIVSQGVLKVQPNYDIKDLPAVDVIAFFGGNAAATSKDPVVIAWLKRQSPEYYFSVCTGAFFLGEAGLLEGQAATTFHNALNDLERNYPQTEVYRKARFVDNGSLITTAGISAGIDGALHLVARIKGFNAARAVAYHMEYDKWVPGEGLILSHQNPYAGVPKQAELALYEGVYEWSNDQSLRIRYQERERSLVAVLDSGVYPLFFEGENRFTDVGGEQVVFQRDKQGRVSSFKVKGQDQTFNRLKMD